MQMQILKSKIHRATLTECELEYVGSLSIDGDLMDAVGMLPHEKILVVNQTNGERLETYAIEAERGTGRFCLNGAAARRGEPGDMVTIMSFALISPEEAETFAPAVAVLNSDNTINTLKGTD
ncbi:MAG: aspartate 1-decarboxylase [Lentisphaeria bacterium]|nr:aspartate 1-decarboxylase [Lentisphaeria bacterium]